MVSSCKVTDPPVGAVNPTRTRNKVDLPDPEGPTKLTTPPFRTVKLTSVRTPFLPYALLKLFIFSNCKAIFQMSAKAR